MKRMSPYCHLYPFSVHYTRSSKRVKRETGRLLLTRLLLTSTAATSEFKFHREKWSHVTIMAMFTRQILGFAIGKHHQSQLVREAVEMALTTASPWQHGDQESCFGTFKDEMGARNRFETAGGGTVWK